MTFSGPEPGPSCPDFVDLDACKAGQIRKPGYVLRGYPDHKTVLTDQDSKNFLFADIAFSTCDEWKKSAFPSDLAVTRSL